MLKVDTFHGQPVETCVATLSLGRFKVMGYSDGGSTYFDVFVEGRDDSVASLRIDEDEGMVTFYDPEADEGHTVFEAEPDDARSMDALTNGWHSILRNRFPEDSSNWGWDLFYTSHGFWEIERDDDAARFEDDDAAIAHVKRLAGWGGEAAQLALGIHYHPDNGAY